MNAFHKRLSEKVPCYLHVYIIPTLSQVKEEVTYLKAELMEKDRLILEFSTVATPRPSISPS